MLKLSLTALTLTALPGAAFAVPARALPDGSECASDGDCSEGFVCEVTGGSSCACEAGTDCDCPVIEYRSCVPGPCQADADCDAGMVCASYESPCSVGAPCTPDGYCPEPEPCEATTINICAPRWVLPCATASDCGDGFDCKPAEVCTCNGGGATEPPNPTDPTEPAPDPDDGASDDASGAPPPEAPDCTCAPSGENYCAALEVACEDDSTCPTGWSCEHFNSTAVDCSPPSGGDSDPGSSGDVPSPPEDPSGKVPCDAAPPAPEPTAGVCYPPYGVAFDSGIPRSDNSAGSTPQYESGTAVPADPQANNTGTPGENTNDTGCQTGATIPVAGLALLMAAMWRRRGQATADSRAA